MNNGDSIGMQCMITKGDLPIDIYWVLNNLPIISGENSLTITRLNPRTSTLNIESINEHHRGIYKCVAANNAGLIEHFSELSVNG